MNKYVTKSERLIKKIKEIAKNYPADPVDLNYFVATIAFDNFFTKKEVLDVITLAEQIGLFEIIGNEIVSIPARTAKITIKKQEDLNEEINNIIGIK